MKIPQCFMVVDDDATSNMICEFALRRFSPNTEIKTFSNPETALKFIEQSYADQNNSKSTVLFLDINMPILNAWDFLDIFKNFPEHLIENFVIYVLTSSIDSRDKEKANLNPLVSGSLCKPLSTNLVRTIFESDLHH